MSEVNPKEILTKFELDSAPPKLDSIEQLAVREYFKEQEMEVTFGSLPFNKEQPSSIRLLLSYYDQDAEREIAKEESTLGPLFMDDEYRPEGVAVWNKNPVRKQENDS